VKTPFREAGQVGMGRWRTSDSSRLQSFPKEPTRRGTLIQHLAAAPGESLVQRSGMGCSMESILRVASLARCG
jgi:hypothetical protein